MTQEDRTLLLKDLSARLPYKVKIQCINSDNETVIEELFTIGIEEDSFDCNLIEYVSVKPYLFPISSMTEEQKKEYNFFKHEVPVCYYEYGDIVEKVELLDSPESFEYLMENHFDYRGLIEKGLAVNAIGLNIY